MLSQHLLRPTRLYVLRAPATRSLASSALRSSSAGYGDPQSEKIENHTPLPKGKKEGKKARAGHETSGTSPSTSTDQHSTGSSESSAAGSGGGKGKAMGGGDSAGAFKSTDNGDTPGTKEAEGSQVRETKKVGEDPKKEEVGGAGVIGG